MNQNQVTLDTTAKMPHILPRTFYARPSIVVARDLIGKTLVRNLAGGVCLRGIVVETEAYGGTKDPASHAFRGMTPRNEIMFGDAGFSYVYFTYGFHNCLNVVTGRKGRAQAVLIRAMEPIEGLEKMKELRGGSTGDPVNLTNGPGKICQALAIDRSLNKVDITKNNSPIYFESSNLEQLGRKVLKSSRIGISAGKDKLWRFYDSSSPYVSHRGKINLGPRLPFRLSRP